MVHRVGEAQSLQSRGQGVAGQRGLHGVVAAAVHDAVAHDIHHVGVVAVATVHGVVAGATVQAFSAAAAREVVVQRVAPQLQAVGVVGADVFHVVRQAEVDVGHDGVGAFAGGLDHRRVGCGNLVGVVARQARQSAHAAFVGSGVAPEVVVGCVAHARDKGGVAQSQVLHVVRQGVGQHADRAAAVDANFVDAFASVFDGRDVQGVRHIPDRRDDDVDVIANTTSCRRHAAQRAGVEGVAQRIAHQGDIVAAIGLDFFHPAGVGDGVVHGGQDHVVAGRVADDIAHVVHGVDVIAGPAHHGVGTDAPVNAVVAGIASDGVDLCVAGGIEVGGAGQGQVFNVGRQGVRDRRVDGVGAGASLFQRRVGHVVHRIGVVARAAGQPVRAGAAVQRVVAVATKERVDAVAAVQGVVARATKQNGVHAACAAQGRAAVVGGERVIGGGAELQLGRRPGGVQRHRAQHAAGGGGGGAVHRPLGAQVGFHHAAFTVGEGVVKHQQF